MKARSQAPRALLATALGALLLAGCQTAGRGPSTTGSINSSASVAPSDLSGADALGAVQRWGAAYTRNEKDKVAAINYANALRAAGETAQGVAVMRKAAIYHATDREVLANYGKALAANGEFQDALRTIRRAQRRDNPDWQLLAAEGGILDSIGDHDSARNLYRQALILAPGEPQILNNLGMSYVLTNELDKAEETLRLAVASPKATLRVRQNLDLVAKLKANPRSARTAAVEEDIAPDPVSDEGADPFIDTTEQDTWKELEQG